jgi:nucleoside phosphorylase
VLLVTVTDIETDAVRDMLAERCGRQFQMLFIGDKTYRDLGAIGGARTLLVRSEMGAGGPGGSLLTISSGIAALRPAAIIMLGIAFGIAPEQQQIGDILISRQLMLYDLQKVGTDHQGTYQVRARGDRPSASAWLLDRFRAGRDSWRGAAIHVGLILSGDKLVDNQNFRAQLSVLEPEAIGGDMEGAGLYVAAQSQKVDWILVKAISDWADGHKSQEKQQRQALAARNAAEYVFHVLAQGGLAPAAPPPGAAPRPATQLPASQLRQLLAERFSSEELQTICFDIGIDPDNLPGQAKSARARELISYLERRNELGRLYAWIQQHRPDIDLS